MSNDIRNLEYFMKMSKMLGNLFWYAAFLFEMQILPILLQKPPLLRLGTESPRQYAIYTNSKARP